MKDNIYYVWMITISVVASILAFTIMTTFPEGKYTLRIEMDNNTKEAMQSINYTNLNQQEYNNLCVNPSSCFNNYSDYLSQFPNNQQPDIYCVDAIYCDWKLTNIRRAK